PTLRDAGPVGRGALVALLVATVVVATSLTGPWDPPLTGEEAPLPTATPGTPPPTLPPDPFTEALDQVDVQPWDLTWLGIALAVLVACGALYLLVRLVRMLPRRRPEDPPEDGGVEPGQTVGAAGGTPDLPALRDGVQGAGEHLAARVPPADAVIAAWVALEEAADRSGLHRDPAATPTEFTVEVLDRTPVDPAAIRTLLVLYLRARFSTDPLGPDDVATATEAVRTLAEGLTARDDGDDGPADPGAPDPPAAPGPPGGPT
ncbi:DUF4129 domain-containing protein, partial [Actinotalea ferrariae]|uniref:DUF4129 domain-containing protein n=1 Tax=Actinotalea ferrariae TaxID=1386098 RepID=UPI001C8CC694